MVDVEGLVMASKEAADAAVASARLMTADPAIDDATVASECHRAQVLVDATARDSVNLLATMLTRWREAQTRALLAAARARFGPQQRVVVELGYEPLR